MTLILNNSRDIGNKFLFGHWMMRKISDIPFIGPGYGRVNYWMNTNDSQTLGNFTLDKAEADMKYMRSIGLKFYVIQLTGKMMSNDGCWKCCDKDESGAIIPDDPAGNIELGISSYFTNKWFEEAKEKYGKLIKLCRKNNLWLLTLVMNDFNWSNPRYKPFGFLNDWIEEYNRHDPHNLEPGSASDHVGIRQEELRLAIKESPVLIKPSEDDMMDVLEKIIVPCSGKERVLVCPVNPIDVENVDLTSKGRSFETKAIKYLKSHGFRTCSFSKAIPGDKKGAFAFQGGHQTKVNNVECPKGKGISSNGTLLYYDIYNGEEPEIPEGEEEAPIIEWWACGKDKVPTECLENVKKLLKNYKQSTAQAGALYAINYDKDSVDKDCLDKIKEGWLAG